jgi:nicotinate dehydrogenase subunit A
LTDWSRASHLPSGKTTISGVIAASAASGPFTGATHMFELDVNGVHHEIDADPGTPLLQILRNDLGLTGTKLGCALEQCLACAVIAGDEVVPSCVSAAQEFIGRPITTIEGLGTPEQLHPVQEAFIEEQAAQCGYCIPAMVVRVAWLLEREPSPGDERIREALEPHLCRCGTHPRVLAATHRAVRELVS